MPLRYASILAIGLLCAAGAAADTPAAPGTLTLSEKSARRFPQPVRVGDLIGRRVLEPVPAQPVLGRVAAIVRNPQGRIDVVVRFGGLLGLGSRPIAVPVEAVALLGEHVAVLDFTPDQLSAFPSASADGGTALPADERIRVGLTKPFH